MNLDDTNASSEENTTEESRAGIYNATTDVQSFDKSSPVANLEKCGVHLTDEQPTVNTTTFCPHCGAKVRVGVVLLPE